jgi:hypothetical protein
MKHLSTLFGPIAALAFGGALLAAALGSGCANPAVTDPIDALGPEPESPGPGPLHRRGQPCLLCHDGGIARDFSAAGTVYATPEEKIPVTGATVTIVDAVGHKLEGKTNCAGNVFWDRESDPVVFPLRAEVLCTLPDGTTRRNVMGSRIDRDGSCSGCHVGSPSATSPGRVSCAPSEPNPAFVAPACEGG